MARRPLIAGNWKMNLGRQDAGDLASTLAAGPLPTEVDAAVFPPALWLAGVADLLSDSRIETGAQNCSEYPRGALTGELAADQIAEIASLVIVGHSERRQRLGETDEVVRAKLDAALRAGLTPILCVGETLEIRQQPDAYVPFVIRQVESALSHRPAREVASVIIAYEPIWAIGTGVAATPDDAQEMCAAIRAAVDQLAAGAGEEIRILYGGSVNPGNARALLTQPDVDGALVGGASLVADDFRAVITAAAGAI